MAHALPEIAGKAAAPAASFRKCRRARFIAGLRYRSKDELSSNISCDPDLEQKRTRAQKEAPPSRNDPISVGLSLDWLNQHARLPEQFTQVPAPLEGFMSAVGEGAWPLRRRYNGRKFVSERPTFDLANALTNHQR
jgi:hypothetical protein